ncbi:MAG: putative phage abortive infection protein [Cyclobacteriaceae bacterium]
MSSKKKKREKRVNRIWISLVVVSSSLTVLFTVLFLLKLENSPSVDSNIDPAIFGQYGDLIGGLVGTLLAGLSAFLIYMTYRSQKAELKATQDALYDQKDETAIFNMLSVLRDIIKDMKGAITLTSDTGHSESKELAGREYFHEATKFFREKFCYEFLSGDLMYNPITHKLHEYNQERTGEFNEHGNEGVRRVPIDKPSVNIDNTLVEIVDGFENQFNNHQHNFDHYFRYVRNIIEFIEAIKVRKYKEFYIKIFKAQLSLDEKVMIFYYTLSVKDDMMFHHSIDSSGILSDINHRKQLFDDWHYLHYPLTDFKFLSNKELADKNDYLNWRYKMTKEEK